MPRERSILTQRSWSVKVIRDFWYAGIWRQVGETLTVPVNTARGMVEAGNAVEINWPFQSTDNPYALQGVGDPYGWVNTPGINLDNGTCKGSITFDQNCSIIFTDGPDGTGDTLLTLTKQGDISVIFQTSELELNNGPCRASIALDPSCDIIFKNGNSDTIATLTQTGDLTVNSLTANHAITTPVLNLSNGTCFDSIGFDASCDIVIADASGTPLLTITPGGEIYTRSNIHSGGNVYAASFIGSNIFVNDGTFYANVAIGGNLTVTGSISGNIIPSGPLTVPSLTLNNGTCPATTIGFDDSCNIVVTVGATTIASLSQQGNLYTPGNIYATGPITSGGVISAYGGLFSYANLTVIGNIVMSTGGSSLAGPITINGGTPCALTINGNLCVSGDISNGGNLTTGGNAQVNGNLNVTGDITINGQPLSGAAGSAPRGDIIIDPVIHFYPTGMGAGGTWERPFYTGAAGWGPWTLLIYRLGTTNEETMPSHVWRPPVGELTTWQINDDGNGWYSALLPSDEYYLGYVMALASSPQGAITWIDLNVF